MARKRGSKKMYRQLKVFSENMGSAGSQVLLAKITGLDPDSMSGFVNNLRATALIQNGDGDNGGIICYASTAASWDDSDVITCAGVPGFGGTMNLSLKRKVTGATSTNRDDGVVYIYGEITDITVSDDVSCRWILECWGSFVLLETA